MVLKAAGVIVLVAVVAAAIPIAAQQTHPASPPADGYSALGDLKRVGPDALAFLRAPGGWESRDWRRAGAFVVTLGGLFAADHRIIDRTQSHRTGTADRIATRTDWIGQPGAVLLSGALLGVGLIAGNDTVRDTGRDALEASVISAVEVGILKTVAGRERPSASGGATVFKPFSSNASFPSGHAAEAFAVASVVAGHSEGWLAPTVAYSVATLVAAGRVVHNQHFASDVFVGAVLGQATGHFLVRRHQANRESTTGRAAESHVSFGLAPTHGGAAVVLTYVN